jgi:hypothetical protein
MYISSQMISLINKSRRKNDFLLIDEILSLSKTNIILDPFSLLISRNAIIGMNNTFFPNVIIQTRNKGKIYIGSSNKIFPGTNIMSANQRILINVDNEIGENGIEIRAEYKDILIFNECRLNNGAQILDGCRFYNGSQVLGRIKVQDCILKEGTSYKESNPNQRGGVLKGFGYAKGLIVEEGEVIFGKGNFEQEMVERQEKYHPNWRK